MKRALDFLRNHVEIAFATCEGNRPRIRIFQIMYLLLVDYQYYTF